MDYNSEEFHQNYIIIKYTLFVTSLLSFLAVLVVVLMYLARRNLRNIAFRMVVYLQVADGIVSFGNVLQIADPIDHQGLCYFQAFTGNLGCVSSFLWTCCISTSIYFTLTGRWRRVEPYEPCFLIIGYVFPLALSIIPFFLEGYGNASYWCWIKLDFIDNTKRDTLILMVFFIYLWIAMIYNSILIFLVFRHFEQLREVFLYSSGDHYLRKIIWYPVAMVICWLVPSLYRICQMAGIEVFWLSWVHAFCEGINGFVNTVIYAYNKNFREEMRNSFTGRTSANYLSQI